MGNPLYDYHIYALIGMNTIHSPSDWRPEVKLDSSMKMFNVDFQERSIYPYIEQGIGEKSPTEMGTWFGVVCIFYGEESPMEME